MTQNGIHGRRVVAQVNKKEWMSDNRYVNAFLIKCQVGILMYEQDEGHRTLSAEGRNTNANVCLQKVQICITRNPECEMYTLNHLELYTRTNKYQSTP